MTDKNRSIIAIANNHISGRDVGAPLTNVALKILMDKSYETQDYRLHYCGMSAKGKALRSSTMFIKQNGKLIGMLCINFDDSKYREASDAILAVPLPTASSEAHVQIDESQRSRTSRCVPPAVSPESFHNSIGDVAEDAVANEVVLSRRERRPSDARGAPQDRRLSQGRAASSCS